MKKAPSRIASRILKDVLYQRVLRLSLADTEKNSERDVSRNTSNGAGNPSTFRGIMECNMISPSSEPPIRK